MRYTNEIEVIKEVDVYQELIRVMAICMATGEAAGVAAALSIKNEVTPRALNPQFIRNELLKNGVKL